MKKIPGEVKVYEMLITHEQFLESYNGNLPEGYPHASLPLLKKFKDLHPMLFKRSELWSLDLHRKRLLDWLPRNLGTA